MKENVCLFPRYTFTVCIFSPAKDVPTLSAILLNPGQRMRSRAPQPLIHFHNVQAAYCLTVRLPRKRASSSPLVPFCLQTL